MVHQTRETRQPSSADETIDDLLSPGRQHRDAAPLRRSFIQDPKRTNTPGPLHLFVAGRRGLALDLLLLLHCTAGADPWDVTLPAMAWARALDMPTTASSETTVSKNWSWLEERHLVRSDRHLRMRRMYLMKEDGSGASYSRYTAGAGERGFFFLPYFYLTRRWHKRLSLPARATLLICLSQKPTFELRTEHATAWLGLSPDSLQRGLDELVNNDVLERWTELRPAPRTRLGLAPVYRYRLIGDFERSLDPADATRGRDDVT